MSERRAVEATLSLLAQLTQGIIGLALLLVAHEVHLDVATGAIAVSAYAVGMSVGRPLQGRALDRTRAAPVLIGCGVAHGAAYVLIALAAHARWAPVYVLGALLAGLALPPVATQLRAAWPALVPAAEAARVFAAITALQTVSVLLAPLLFTVVDAIGSATDAMLNVAAVSAICTVLFGLTCRDAVRPRRPDGRAGLRRYAILLVMTGLLGAVVGTLEVCAPAIAIGAGHPGAAGPLVATSTIGTLVGSALAIRRPFPLPIALTLQVLGAGMLLVPASLVLTAAALFVLGIGFTPALSVLSVAVSRRAGGTAESFGWQSTALGLGVAGGSAIAGGLATVSAHLSAAPCVAGALACLVLVSAVPVVPVRDEQRNDGGEDRGDHARNEQGPVHTERR